MRSHRTTRFGDYRRMRQTFSSHASPIAQMMLLAYSLRRSLRSSQTANGCLHSPRPDRADVEALNIDAQLVQFHIETPDSRTPVAISRIFAICEPRWSAVVAGCRDARLHAGFQPVAYLSRSQAELRFFPAGGLPFTEPCEARRARTPRRGTTFRRLLHPAQWRFLTSSQ